MRVRVRVGECLYLPVCLGCKDIFAWFSWMGWAVVSHQPGRFCDVWSLNWCGYFSPFHGRDAGGRGQGRFIVGIGGDDGGMWRGMGGR